MPHIHTDFGQHDHTASAYIIRTDGDEPRIMFHKHKKLGVYLQFGGHIELDETPWSAITHELREESGYSLDQLQILQPSSRLRTLSVATLHPVAVYHNTHAFDEKHFHTDIAYAFITDQPPAHTIATNESSDIRLLTRQELIALPPEQTYESVREPALFVLDECLKNWERIDTASFA